MAGKKTTKPQRTEKRPTIRKGKAAQKADDSKDEFAKELRTLIPRLDAEGLRFLVEQAQIHLYNMQVEELNRTMERSAIVRSNIEGKKARAQEAADTLRIEGSNSGSSFYIVYKGQWIMFSRDEIIHMVNIVSAPVTNVEKQENLLNWFTNERRDVLAAIPIADKFDERLNKITALLKKNFRVKKQ